METSVLSCNKEMKHDWEIGWKELKLRGGFFDVCKRCGIGKWNGITTEYIHKDDVTRVATTYKMVISSDYIHCEVAATAAEKNK